MAIRLQLSLLIGLLLVPVGAAEWPLHHKDSTNIGSEGENPAGTSFEQWVVEGGSASAKGGPIVVNGTVFVGGDGMRAYDARSGALKWIRRDYTMLESLAYAHGLLYITANRSLVALDPATGRDVWRFRVDDAASTNPVVSDGLAYFVTQRGRLYAVDARSGDLRWDVALENAAGPAGVLVSEGIVLVNSAEGRIHAVDARTGELRWAYGEKPRSEEQYPANTMPTAMDGVYYVAGLVDPLSVLTAFDVRTGEVVWRVEEPWWGRSAPAAADGRVFVNCPPAYSFCAYDARTGDLLWQFPVCGVSPAGSVVAEGVVYVETQCGAIAALSTTNGRLLRRFAYDGHSSHSTPAYANGVLYLQHNVFDYNPPIGTGEPIRTWNLTAFPVARGQTRPHDPPEVTPKPAGGWEGGLGGLLSAAFVAGVLGRRRLGGRPPEGASRHP